MAREIDRAAGVEGDASGRDVPELPHAGAGGALVRQSGTTTIGGVRYRIVDAKRVTTPIDHVEWSHSKATVTDGGTLRYVAARLEKI